MNAARGLLVLAALLVVQLWLVVRMWEPQFEPAVPRRPLMQVDQRVLRRIAIWESPDAEPVRLQATPGGWVVASEANYPAKPQAIATLLDILTSVHIEPSAVGRGDSQFDALGVGPDWFDRRIVLSDADASYGVLIGGTYGNASHVRIEGQQLVYRAPRLTIWTIPVKPASYYDRTYLKLNPSQLMELRVSGPAGEVVLTWTVEGQPRLENPPKGQILNPRAVQRLVDTLTQVRIRNPVGTQVDPSMGLDGSLRVAWVVADPEGGTRTGQYVVGVGPDGTTYAKRDANPFVVQVPSTLAQAVQGASAEALTVPAGR